MGYRLWDIAEEGQHIHVSHRFVRVRCFEGLYD